MIINWSNYNWLTQERWGQIHPNKTMVWYDESCVSIINSDLYLEIKQNPKQFVINNQTVTPKYGVGLVTCETDFGYGYFEIEAKLPKGVGLWSAFWLYSSTSWPPEIDVFEGYSHNDNYKANFLKSYRVNSCVHYSINGIHKQTSAKTPWIWEFNTPPDESFNKYGLLWDKDKIILYINGRVVRKFCTKYTKYTNDYKMRVILNNSIEPAYLAGYKSETPFIIKSFTYK